jgi:transcriptional regulator with AAA-type ATPase domain
VESHPKVAPQARTLRVHCLINLGEWDALDRLDPSGLPEDLARLLEAIRTRCFDPVPEGLDEEGRLLWESLRSRLGAFDAVRFWEHWERCPNALMRLGCGLHVMEAHPGARIPGRLLALQELAQRCGSEVLRTRLSRLWPAPTPSPSLPPDARLLSQLSGHPGPAWIMWGEAWEHRLGQGDPPPSALGDVLDGRAALEPFAAGAWIWWGRLLTWQEAPVGWIVLGFDRNRVIEPPPWVDLLAPWVAALRAEASELPFVEGQALLTNGSEPMASFLRELDQVAPSRLSVLIQGPSGSGKELAARELHLRSGRKGPLVAVNCSEFAPGVLESELFGHVKGAFTGAARDKVGAIESARHGTLFLDEVADLDPRLQSMLLRVLQEREIRRVGSDRPVQVDVRFIAATHRDLDLLVAEGRFRKDLLFRLQGARLQLPSLDERRHELSWLLPRLISQICREELLPVPALAPGVAQALARRRWPGNFRELRHVLQRALLRAKGGVLSVGHFPELAEPAAMGGGWEESTRDFQRKLLLDTLRAHDFQVADAARALGLARPALYAAAKRLGLDVLAERHKSR